MSDQPQFSSKSLSRDELRQRGLWCDKHSCERDVDSDCHRCHGDGTIEDQDDVIGGSTERCYACNGTGIGWPDCEFCLDEECDL